MIWQGGRVRVDGARGRERRGGVKRPSREISWRGYRGLCWGRRRRGEGIAEIPLLEVQDDVEVFRLQPRRWCDIGTLLAFKQHG